MAEMELVTAIRNLVGLLLLLAWLTSTDMGSDCLELS